MKTVLIVTAVGLGLMAFASDAEAKCLKVTRWIDGITKNECAKIKGVWRDARFFLSPRPMKRVTRPRVQ